MRRVLMLLAAIGLGACTLVYDLDDLAGGASNADAGAFGDGSSPSGDAASDAGGDAPVDAELPDAPFTIDCADGVVGHWAMDEGNGMTVGDRCPNALHGTIVSLDGGATWGTRGDGGALELSGNAYVSLGKHSQFQLEGPFTIAGFMRVTSSPDGYIAVWYNYVGGGNIGVELLVDFSGTGYAQVGFGSTSTKVEIGAFGTLKWKHFAVVFVPNERVEVFVNGEAVAKGVPPAGSGTSVPSEGEVRFGPVFDTASWAGALDDIVVYKRALTNDQIGALSRR